MLDNYINNINVFLINELFFCFKYAVITFVTLLILSLILLTVGLLIKSQKLKSKFLIVVPLLIIANIFILALPLIFVHIKNSF